MPFRAANQRPLSDQTSGRVIFGQWGVDSGEEVVVCLVDDQTLEIHCHGGEAAAARILDDCTQAGCHIVTWTEMKRATEGRLAAELAEALAQTTTLRTAGIVLEQSNGVLRRELESMESECDLQTLSQRIDALLRWSNFGIHLTRPWNVVLAGRPNVGKSSLINALLGYTRSIVFDQPGTTRDVVTATTAIDGWPMEFADTAGLRVESEPLEAAGILRARSALAEADLMIVLVDISVPASEEDRQLLAGVSHAVVVAHKCDLPQWTGVGSWPNETARNWPRVSAKTGDGVDELLRTISARMVPTVPPPGMALPVTPRQVSLLQEALQAVSRTDLPACRRALREILA
ncbi:MAG TPA: GTPase [Planctomycetaceae bacterium]|nr:GTPase [Planctomycetaceae bacterium]